jgi:tRNA-dihydrouridine synthase B
MCLRANLTPKYTGADALMIGRAAQGQPWIFRQIDHYFKTGKILATPPIKEIQQILLTHVNNVHQFYGEYLGVRFARKHISWYLQKHDPDSVFRKQFNAIESAAAQLEALTDYFLNLQFNLEREKNV